MSIRRKEETLEEVIERIQKEGGKLNPVLRSQVFDWAHEHDLSRLSPKLLKLVETVSGSVLGSALGQLSSSIDRQNEKGVRTVKCDDLRDRRNVQINGYGSG